MDVLHKNTVPPEIYLLSNVRFGRRNVCGKFWVRLPNSENSFSLPQYMVELIRVRHTRILYFIQKVTLEHENTI